MISKEIRDKIIENNKKISTLMQENENMLRDSGYELPVQNVSFRRHERIQFPVYYIRNNKKFQSAFHLNEIVQSKIVVKNIAYSLQLSDWHNYIINRYNMWGSVNTMLIKSAVINLISIFEAVIFECANNICCNASSCNQTKTCERNFNKEARNSSSYKALLRMNELGITQFTEKRLKRINEIIGLRNKVHIRLANDNEFIASDFSVELYNEVIMLLRQVCDDIYRNGVPLYYKCKH